MTAARSPVGTRRTANTAEGNRWSVATAAADYSALPDRRFVDQSGSDEPVNKNSCFHQRSHDPGEPPGPWLFFT